MSFKIIKSMKDITPILATLLLIVVAVAAVAVTCDWIMTSNGITATETGKQIHESSVDFAGLPHMRVNIDNFVTIDAKPVSMYMGLNAT